MGLETELNSSPPINQPKEFQPQQLLNHPVNLLVSSLRKSKIYMTDIDMRKNLKMFRLAIHKKQIRIKQHQIRLPNGSEVSQD